MRSLKISRSGLISACCFFSTTMRLRLRFSSLGFGRVSLLAGKFNFSHNFRPFNFYAFNIFNNYRLFFYSSCNISSSSTGFSASISSFSSFRSCFYFFGSVSFFVPFAASFLGLVEESIVLRSILSSTLGFSSSGASIFIFSGCGCFYNFF